MVGFMTNSTKRTFATCHASQDWWFQCRCLHNKPLLTHASTGDPQTLTGSLVILFAPGSIYADVKNRPEWQAVTAIRNGEYYEVPFGPYNWMGFPPSVQRYLGMMWMSQLLYPETAQYDLYEAVKEYFRLFYHCDITREQYDALVANSIGVQADGVARGA